MKLEDRRVRRTKHLIKQSLIELMYEKPFKDITVTDITKRADLNRGTFYLHYIDIYDLLSKIENEILNIINQNNLSIVVLWAKLAKSLELELW